MKRIKPGVLRNVISILEDTVTNADNASFTRITNTDPYPTNEAEAAEFIKGRIRLWQKSWTEEPVNRAIAELKAELRRIEPVAWKLGDEFKITERIHLTGEEAGDICRVIGFDPDGIAVHYSNLTRDLNEKFLPDSPFAKNLIVRL